VTGNFKAENGKELFCRLIEASNRNMPAIVDIVNFDLIAA